MLDASEVLQIRYGRLETEYDEAESVGDEDAMCRLQNQMNERAALIDDV